MADTDSTGWREATTAGEGGAPPAAGRSRRQSSAKKRVGIIDVAKAAGVSTATVSFVLAGKQPVADATRERVLKVVQELGYTRNRHARALRRGSAPTLSAVIPDVTNPFYAELMAAIENAARERGWNVTLLNCQLDPTREVAYLSSVFDDAPDGILYIPLTPDAAATVEPLFASGPPFVVLDELTTSAGAGGVAVDNEAGARMIARHFAETGRTRVLISSPPRGLPTSEQRRLGFLDEASKLGLDVARTTFGSVRTSDAVAAATATLIEDRSIDAYFAGNDFLAIQVLFRLQRAGIRVPEEVAIAGFDGIAWGQMISPKLTTVRQPLRALADTALDLLIDPNRGDREVVLPVELIRGQTS